MKLFGSTLCLSVWLALTATVVGSTAVTSKTCGTSVQDSDLAIMVSPDVFESGARCGDDVTVQFQGKSVVVTVAGECVCIASSIELTDAAFSVLGVSFMRPVTLNWAFD
ncbi:hypothetical protein B0H12DRAFT_1072504 [Mycena haematopus]|nr:hypothetical protein B0H12DRAFT_1072504 [Mycena haematopus]